MSPFARAPFAYDRSGSVIAVACGAELFAYRGADEQPLWRKAGEAPLAGVCTTASEVVTIDERGQLARYEALSGAPLGTLALGKAAHALVLARDGSGAVLLDDEIALVTGGQLAKRLAAEGATAIALSDDGRLLAVGGEQRVRLLDGRSGEARGEAAIEGAPAYIAWNVRGLFVIASGERLFRIDADGRAARSLVKLGARRPSELACSADGGLIACRVAANEVQVIALPSLEVVARLEWDRDGAGLAFGPDVWLGAGTGGGDASRINLQSGEVRRTDPHPGRSRSAATVEARIDQEKIREARSTANPSAEAVQRKLAEKARAQEPRSRALFYLLVAVAVLGTLAAWLFAGR